MLPDPGASERRAALHAVLKTCHLHPLDTTPGAEVVIVQAEAFRAQILPSNPRWGRGDLLHLVSAQGERLVIDVIAAAKPPTISPPVAHRIANRPGCVGSA
jgi:hypothetical protein